MINGSVTGLRDELRALQPGEMTTRVLRCPPSDAYASFRAFSQSVASITSKTTGDFTTFRVDDLVDEGRSAVRCIVITRNL